MNEIAIFPSLFAMCEPNKNIIKSPLFFLFLKMSEYLRWFEISANKS